MVLLVSSEVRGHHVNQWWLDYRCIYTSPSEPMMVRLPMHIYVTRPQWVKWRMCVLPSLSNIVHDDVIKWKHFPRYWPFVRGIRRLLVNSPHKGQWRGALAQVTLCRSGGPDLYDLKSRGERHGRSWSRSNVVLPSWKSARSGKDRQWSGSQKDSFKQ